MRKAIPRGLGKREWTSSSTERDSLKLLSPPKSPTEYAIPEGKESLPPIQILQLSDTIPLTYITVAKWFASMRLKFVSTSGFLAFNSDNDPSKNFAMYSKASPRNLSFSRSVNSFFIRRSLDLMSGTIVAFRLLAR